MKLLGFIISILISVALMYLSENIQIDRLYKGMIIGSITASIFFIFYDIDQKK